jgi:hypothetical protein
MVSNVLARSPSVPLLDQHGQAVGRQRRHRRKLEVPRFARCAPDLEHFRSVRDDPRHRSVSIQHRQRRPIADEPQVLAETRFQVRNPNTLHDHIMAISGHGVRGPRFRA